MSAEQDLAAVAAGGRTVRVDEVRRILTGRRTELEHALRHGHPLDPATGAARAAELADVERLLERLIAERARPDWTRTTRPGVLLVGAGIRGEVTVRADAETLNAEYLSDRDLAVYTGLVRHVGERLEREVTRRRRWLTLATAPDLDVDLAETVRPVGWTLGDPAVGDAGDEQEARTA